MNWEAVRRRAGSFVAGNENDVESDDAERANTTDTSSSHVTRRRLLAGAGGLTALGAGKAVDNVFLGYGVLLGTNLITQDLATLSGQRLGPTPFETTVDGTRVTLAGGGQLTLTGEEGETTISLAGTGSEEGAAIDERHGLPGVVEELVRDDPILAAMGGAENAAELPAVRFEFHQYGSFFDRLRDAETRPFTVMRLRGDRYRPTTTETVRRFTGADAAEPKGIVEGLVGGFRQYSNYDLRRYTAGSVEDNVLMGHGDLRRHFESPVSFDALLAGENTGLFCYEFVHRSIEALHALPAHEQSAPVFGGVVTDYRHKHAYTAVGSVLREDGDLVVPVTFVDYTHSTLYDDLYLRGLLGRGLKAYDDRHRASDIFWNGYARV
ncbi:hypothetical protein [Haloarchaeobius sp. TZWWS8]|uniref:hypothetical protein n=1 Tax=Haloarchaeobius sp. TZWWS8 TaxID=3446121 RepID=UPI003EC00F6A